MTGKTNAVVHASQILELSASSSREAVLEAVAKIAEFLAIWPDPTPSFVVDLRTTAVDHLLSIGVEDAVDLVEVTILKGVETKARYEARDELLAMREKEIDARAMHTGPNRSLVLVNLAATMRRGGADEVTIHAALVAENRRCEPPLLPPELTEIARRVSLYSPQEVPRTRLLVTEVKKALKPGPPPVDETLPNFKVDKVVVADSDPPRYWLTIDGHDYLWTAEELSSATRFKLRFIKAVRRVPLRLPKTPEVWDELVDGWLAKATTVVQPPDASPEIFIRDHVSRGLEGLAIGDGLIDVESGKGIVHEGRLCFKSIAAVRIARELEAGIGSHQVCGHLRLLGFENVVINLRVDPDQAEYKAVRVWRSATPVELTPETPDTPPTGNGHAAVSGDASMSALDIPAPTEDPDESFDLPL